MLFKDLQPNKKKKREKYKEKKEPPLEAIAFVYCYRRQKNFK